MSKFKKIGAVWQKTSSKGDTFYAGKIEVDGKPIEITIFSNKNKKTDKHPDFEVFIKNTESEDEPPVPFQ